MGFMGEYRARKRAGKYHNRITKRNIVRTQAEAKNLNTFFNSLKRNITSNAILTKVDRNSLLKLLELTRQKRHAGFLQRQQAERNALARRQANELKELQMVENAQRNKAMHNQRERERLAQLVILQQRFNALKRRR